MNKHINSSYFLHIEGMDLAGKSTVAKNFAETSKLQWVINDKRLTKNNIIYDFAWNLGKTSNCNSEILGHLYLAALMNDIKTFQLDTNIIQDSTLLLRSLNYYKTVKINDKLAQAFSEIVPFHPLPSKSFYLTANIKSRYQRLNKRIEKAPESLTSMDMLIKNDPNKFLEIDESLRELSVKYFNSQIIDTSEMNEIELVECMRSCCPPPMQK